MALTGAVLAAIVIWRAGWPSSLEDMRTLLIFVAFAVPAFALPVFTKDIYITPPTVFDRIASIAGLAFAVVIYVYGLVHPGAFVR